MGKASRLDERPDFSVPADPAGQDVAFLASVGRGLLADAEFVSPQKCRKRPKNSHAWTWPMCFVDHCQQHCAMSANGLAGRIRHHPNFPDNVSVSRPLPSGRKRSAGRWTGTVPARCGYGSLKKGKVGLSTGFLMRQAECMSASAVSDFDSTAVFIHYEPGAAMFW